jgi:hypothetical protein
MEQKKQIKTIWLAYNLATRFCYRLDRFGNRTGHIRRSTVRYDISIEQFAEQ